MNLAITRMMVMNPRTKIVMWVLFAVGALVLASCGNDGGGMWQGGGDSEPSWRG